MCVIARESLEACIGAAAGQRHGKSQAEMWQKNGISRPGRLLHTAFGIVLQRAFTELKQGKQLHMARRIAIVEDDAAIRENYADALRRQGYEVTTFVDRPAAMKAMQTRLPDLALIDIGLANEIEGGFALCRDLRALSSTLPIIFLTARDGDLDTVSGLRMGADDYLTKDISLPHLLARIAALFRRIEVMGSPPAAEDVLERGRLRLNVKRMEAPLGHAPGRTDLDRILDRACACQISWPCERPRRADAGSQPDGGRQYHYISYQAHPPQVQCVDSRFDSIQSVYGLGYRWHGES